MAIDISDVLRRVVYAPNGTGPYQFTFEVLTQTDIAVYRGSTLLTLTTDYTVSLNLDGTGSVTLVTTAGTSNITIVGDRGIARSTDFVTGGDLLANSLNEELDAQTIFNQQTYELALRGLKAPVYDPTDINMTLPSKSSRANKTLSFDADGNPTPGVSAADVANAVTYATNAANSATAAAASASAAASSASSASSSASTATTQASNASTSASNASTSATNASNSASSASTSASNAATSATNAANSASAASTSATNASNSATAASTSASNASTSATNASNSATAAATSETNAATSAAAAAAALDNFDDRYLGAKSSNPTVDNDGNALLTGALYYRTTTPVGMKVYDGAQWLEASAAQQSLMVTYEFVATSGQTTFSGTDANGATLSYVANSISVSLNGVTLRPGDDYTATNGTSVVLNVAAALNDDLMVIAFAVFNVANAVAKTGDTMTGSLLLPAGTVSAPALTTSADTNTGIFFPAADTIAFSEGGVESMRIDASGNLGLGVTPSAWGSTVRALEVARIGTALTAFSANNSLFTSNAYFNGTNWIYAGSAAASYYQQSAGTHAWWNAASGTAGNTITFTQAMTLNASGNLVIGNSTASQRFQVEQNYNGSTWGYFVNTNAGSGAAAGILMKNDTGDLGAISLLSSTQTAANALFIRSLSTNPLTFGTNGTERARIDSSGRLLIGTSTVTNGTRLMAYDGSTTSSTLGGFYAGSTSYASSVQVNWCDRSGNSAYNFFVTRSNNDSDTEHSLRGDGNAYADGTWNNNGADYAEFFESATGAALTLGATVVLDGNKVRETTSQDPTSAIIGVVRPKEPSKASMVVGNTAWNKWANKYLTDEFDRYIMEDHDVVEWTDEDGKQHSYESHHIPAGVAVPNDAVVKTHDDKGNKFQHYKLNPAWDKDAEYTPREQRPEWNIIGLVGQVKVLKGQPVNDRWIKMRDVSDTVEEWFIR
jgi:hypothetical protein